MRRTANVAPLRLPRYAVLPSGESASEPFCAREYVTTPSNSFFPVSTSHERTVAESGRPEGVLQAASAELLRLPIDWLLRSLALFSPLGRILPCLGLALIAAALFLVAFDPVFRQTAVKPLGALLSLQGGAAAAVAMAAVSILAHELSHCYAASCWGISTGTVKVQLYRAKQQLRRLLETEL